MKTYNNYNKKESFFSRLFGTTDNTSYSLTDNSKLIEWYNRTNSPRRYTKNIYITSCYPRTKTYIVYYPKSTVYTNLLFL